MKIDFPHEKLTIVKMDDNALDYLINSFLLPKLKALCSPKHKNDYDGYDGYENKYFMFRHNNGVKRGKFYHYFVFPDIKLSQKKRKTPIDIEMDASTSNVLNWMCADGLIEEGHYLIECVNDIT